MSRTVCGECWCLYDELDGSCACPKLDKGNPMTETIDALVEALRPFAEVDLRTRGVHQKFAEHVLAARAALAQARAEQAEPVEMPDAMRDFIEGMEVSVDVSTCEGDSQNRYFGLVSEVMDNPDSKHGVILLVQNSEPNFTPPAAPVAKLEPLSEREIDLIDGMIEVQLHHAAQCDGIANRTMATKQKGWDMERVELLRKLKAAHNAKLSK